MAKIDFNEEMKKYFYEFATCDEKEFKEFKANLKNDKSLTPKVQSFMNIFIKNVNEARKVIRLGKAGK